MKVILDHRSRRRRKPLSRSQVILKINLKAWLLIVYQSLGK